MEIFLNTVLPILVIVIIAVLYILFLYSRRGSMSGGAAVSAAQEAKRRIPSSAALTLYMDAKIMKFYDALKTAIPSTFIIIPHTPIEKLFKAATRDELQMKGQYADFAVFSPAYMPVLIIDLFDMSIVNLETVNRIKTISKDILKNSGIPVLDFTLRDTYSVDELRRLIADTLNPLRSAPQK